MLNGIISPDDLAVIRERMIEALALLQELIEDIEVAEAEREE